MVSVGKGLRNCDPEKRCVAESLLEGQGSLVTVISRRKETFCITPIELYFFNFFTYTHLLPKNSDRAFAIPDLLPSYLLS